MIEALLLLPVRHARIGMSLSAQTYQLMINTLESHLIADHLGWFKDTEGAESKGRTIEDFMRAKGEKVTRGRLGEGGAIEYIEDEVK